MKPVSVPRVAVIAYFALIFLIAALRGWQAYQAASTPVDCTEGPCDAGVDYATLGLQAGGLVFLISFIAGLALFLIVWAVLKAMNKNRSPAA